MPALSALPLPARLFAAVASLVLALTGAGHAARPAGQRTVAAAKPAAAAAAPSAHRAHHHHPARRHHAHRQHRKAKHHRAEHRHHMRHRHHHHARHHHHHARRHHHARHHHARHHHARHHHLGTGARRLLHADLRCRGGRVWGYANGHLPWNHLCPLWHGDHKRLVPSAAHAFDRMSAAYTRHFGRSICVVDAYRSYGRQVRIKRIRGRWAAVPGTSRHGLGHALDLGCGVNVFGSAAHRWMNHHARHYGFHHPWWAEPRGPLPEPWHWEWH